MIKSMIDAYNENILPISIINEFNSYTRKSKCYYDELDRYETSIDKSNEDIEDLKIQINGHNQNTDWYYYLIDTHNIEVDNHTEQVDKYNRMIYNFAVYEVNKIGAIRDKVSKSRKVTKKHKNDIIAELDSIIFKSEEKILNRL